MTFPQFIAIFNTRNRDAKQRQFEVVFLTYLKETINIKVINFCKSKELKPLGKGQHFSVKTFSINIKTLYIHLAAVCVP